MRGHMWWLSANSCFMQSPASLYVCSMWDYAPEEGVGRGGGRRMSQQSLMLYQYIFGTETRANPIVQLPKEGKREVVPSRGIGVFCTR